MSFGQFLEDPRSVADALVAQNELSESFLMVRYRAPVVDMCVAIGDRPDGWTAWDRWLADAPERLGNTAAIESSDATVQVYTSRRMRRPKRAILTHGSLTATMAQNLTPQTHIGSELAGIQNLSAGGSAHVQGHFELDPPLLTAKPTDSQQDPRISTELDTAVTWPCGLLGMFVDEVPLLCEQDVLGPIPLSSAGMLHISWSSAAPNPRERGLRD